MDEQDLLCRRGSPQGRDAMRLKNSRGVERFVIQEPVERFELGRGLQRTRETNSRLTRDGFDDANQPRRAPHITQFRAPEFLGQPTDSISIRHIEL